MSLEDFMTGLNAFTQGVQQLQTSRTLRKANKEIQRIRQSEEDDAVKQQALTDIGRNLAFNLAAQGGSASGIKSLLDTFQPSAQQLPQSPFQAFMMGGEAAEGAITWEALQEQQKAEAAARADERVRARSEESFNRSNQAREGKEYRSTLLKQQGEFNKASKVINESLTQARNAIQLLDSGNPLTATAIGTMMARASGERGNLTEVERANFAGRQDLYSRILRDLSIKGYSNLPKADRDAIKEVAEIYSNTGEKLLRQEAETRAEQLKYNSLFIDEDRDVLLKKITGGRFKSFEDPQPQTQAGTQGTGAPVTNPFKKGFTPR